MPTPSENGALFCQLWEILDPPLTLLFQVMMQPYNRHASFSLYISVLAVSDTIVLSTGMSNKTCSRSTLIKHCDLVQNVYISEISRNKISCRNLPEDGQCFVKKSWRTSVLFVGPLIPLFCLQVTSDPGFKARMDSLSCLLHCLQIYLWCDILLISRVAEPFYSKYLHTNIGGA